MHAGGQVLHILPDQDRAHRNTTGKRLGTGQQIWRNTKMLDRKHLSRAPKARLDFVHDQQVRRAHRRSAAQPGCIPGLPDTRRLLPVPPPK